MTHPDLRKYIQFMNDNGWNAIVDFNEDPVDCTAKPVSFTLSEIKATESVYVKWTKEGQPNGWSHITPYEGTDFLCDYLADSSSGTLQDQWLDQNN